MTVGGIWFRSDQSNRSEQEVPNWSKMAVNWWRLKYKWIQWLTDLGCHWWLSSNFPHPSSSRENVPLISSCSAWWSKEKTSMSQRTDGSQYIIRKHSWRSTLWLVLATLWFFIGSLLAYLPTSGCENEEIFWNIGKWLGHLTQHHRFIEWIQEYKRKVDSLHSQRSTF